MSERIPTAVAIRVPLYAYLTGTSTPATGKTIAITVSKNGAAYGNPSGGATNATEIGNGAYYVDLTTTDTGTAGPLLVRGTNVDIDPVQVPPYNVVNAHNAGFDGVPNATAAASGGLPTVGTGTGQLSLASGGVDVQTIKTQTITAAAGITFSTTVGTSTLTAAQAATAVWQDTTAGDFTTAGSIGKSLFTSGAVPGAAGGIMIAGSNAATTFATLTVTGALTLTGGLAGAMDGTITYQQGFQAMLAILNGVSSGFLGSSAATGAVFKNPGGTKNRVTVNTDANANKTSIVNDFT